MNNKEIFRQYYIRRMNESTSWQEARNYCKAAGEDESVLFAKWFLDKN